jgi:folylpolyglutamate synthase/dihydrofolate synthase
MTFKELTELLKKRSCGGKKGNLSLLKKTAKKLGVLPVNYKTVLIAGTNGKGTVAHLLAEAAMKSGFKTGLFTSPHIFDIRERISVNNKEISQRDFCSCLEKVLSAEVKPLKFFELLTLSALVYFKEKKVDFAVFECGIGGLKDSTNIIDAGLSIITSVAKDHEKLLGNTLEEIAFQKAGIIKKEKPCVLGQVSPKILKIIEDICIKESAPLIVPVCQNVKLDFLKNETEFTYRNKKYILNMLGEKAAQNATLVISASNILGFNKGLKNALLKIALPARFEIKKIGKNYLIQDGAHNPAAIKEFLNTFVKSPYFKQENILVYGVNAEKDYKTCAKLLNSYFKKICLAEFKKSCPKEKLKKYFKNCAFINVKDLAKTKANIVQVGSFYLSCELKKYLPKKQL